MWLLHSTSRLTSVPVCFTSTGTSLSKTYIFFLSAFTKEKQKASAMPEITILVAKQPMDKIPASLILFSKFLIIIIVCLNFNESFYIAALAPPVAGAATVLVAMAAPPTIPL